MIGAVGISCRIPLLVVLPQWRATATLIAGELSQHWVRSPCRWPHVLRTRGPFGQQHYNHPLTGGDRGREDLGSLVGQASLNHPFRRHHFLNEGIVELDGLCIAVICLFELAAFALFIERSLFAGYRLVCGITQEFTE